MLPIFLPVNVKVEERRRRLLRVECLNELRWVLIPHDAALSLNEPVKCLVERGVFELRVDQVIGVESELVEFLLSVPDEDANSVDRRFALRPLIFDSVQLELFDLVGKLENQGAHVLFSQVDALLGLGVVATSLKPLAVRC